MRPTTELVRIWTEALVPVCNNSKSHASQELKWLLQHAKHQSRPSLAAGSVATGGGGKGGSLSEKEVELMQGYVDERVKTRKPLQYILGTQPFMDLEILTRPPTLIPRWETEEWTARLATTLKSNPLIFRQRHQQQITSTTLPPRFNILDICSGSGCIPLGLASALPLGSSRLFGVDIHPKAVQLARENAAHNQALLNQNLVSFYQADLLAPNAVDQFLSWLEDDHGSCGVNSTGKGQERYNLIISNPPYIAHSEYESLEPEVAQWEDPKALLADREGLVFYPRIAHMAMELLHRQPADSRSSSSSSSSSSPTSSSSSSPSSVPPSVVVEDQNSKRLTRELDPRTLERIDSLDHDEQQYHSDNSNSNHNSDNSRRAQENEEAAEDEDVERTWRNGPELDRVKIPELVFEIGGDHQVDFVSAAVRQAGFRRVQVWKDLADRARCIVGAR
ncbi:hypothetical protein BG015_001481 [Linnemannia schmuckeri]|uniref:S-adenosyl-L-methionine-dependent methyltransferase n=1 Tax=Linnemannia schmuckeri TaxID=64567 RepID=A0A9P5S3H5_9FUNG|nr:hypothetical protein BG015_001481 [Linnemannia schmuckeri]